MAMTSQTTGDARNAGAPLSPSGRWSALWGAGMLLMFVGERMIGAGKSRNDHGA